MSCTTDYATAGPVWFQTLLLIALTLKVLIKYIYKMTKAHTNNDFRCESCCGLFAGSAEMSDNDEDKVHSHREEEPKRTLVDKLEETAVGEVKNLVVSEVKHLVE